MAEAPALGAQAGSVEVKICGLCRREDVLHADGAGADYLGFIASDGFGRSVERGALTALGRGVRATTVAVLVDETLEEAAARARLLGAGVVQLHGDEDPAVAAALRAAGSWKVWKALRIRSLDELESGVRAFDGAVDGLLVEGWRPNVQGGGGAGVDPAWAEGVRASVPPSARFILAGGLTADTVYRAVARFQPDVVDVSSGVEASHREKSPDAVTRFIREARRGTPSDPRLSPSDILE